MVAAVLACLHLLLTPALWPVDETAHVAYADHVASHLTLPEVDDPIPSDRPWPGLDQRLGWERQRGYDGRQDIWTANHPPLPSLAQGVVLRVGLLVSPSLALGLARLTSVAWFLVAVWLAMHLAALLLPGRPRAVLGAGLLLAITPTATHVSGLVFTDAAAMAAMTGCLLVGARMVLEGPSPVLRWWMAAAAGAAGLIRVSVLPAVAVMVGLALVAHLRDPEEAASPAEGVRTVGVPIAVAMLPAALFWLRNLVLLGGVSGSAALLEKFDRAPNDPLESLLTDRWFWLRLWNRLWADLTTGHWNVWPRRGVTELILWLVVAGLAWQVAVRGRALWSGARLREALPMPRDLVLVWGAIGLLVLAQVSAVVTFHSAGGSLHGRYLLGVHPVLCIAAVWLAGSMPRVGVAAVAALHALAGTAGVWLLVDLVRSGSSTWNRGPLRIDLPHLAGVWTGPLAMALVLVGLLAVASLAVSLRDLPADPPTPWPGRRRTPAVRAGRSRPAVRRTAQAGRRAATAAARPGLTSSHAERSSIGMPRPYR